MAPHPRPWTGAVLTGGASRRMGRDKALLTVDGTAMARRVADALTAAGAAEVFAVGGDLDALNAAGLRAVPDEHPGAGPLGGVLTALRAASHEPVVVLSCDLVAPDAAVIGDLVGVMRREPHCQLVVPEVEGRPQWLHGVWARSTWPLVERCFDGGARAVGDAARSFRSVRFVAADGAAVRDADRPSDLEISGG